MAKSKDGPGSTPVIRNGPGMWTSRGIVSMTDCPHLLMPENRKVRDDIIREFGINSPLVQSMCFGRFVNSEKLHPIFDVTHIKECRMAMRGMGKPYTGRPKAAIDFSGGGDNHSVVFAEGTKVTRIEDFSEGSEIKAAEELVVRFKAFNMEPFDVFVDGGGLGQTIIKHMEQNLGFLGVRKYLNNRRPRNRKVFADRYTEDHFRLRRMLATATITFACGLHDALLEQMKARLYIVRDGEVIKCEPKEKLRNRGLRSPDTLDALVMVTTDVEIEGYGDAPSKPDEPTRSAWDEAGSVSSRGRLGPLMKQKRPNILKGRSAKAIFGSRRKP